MRERKKNGKNSMAVIVVKKWDGGDSEADAGERSAKSAVKGNRFYGALKYLTWTHTNPDLT